MSLLQVCLASLYLLIAVTFFQNWYDAYKRDLKNMDEEDIFVSRVILGLATLLWPVVVPVSYLRMLKNSKRVARRGFDSVIPITKIGQSEV